MKNQTWVLKDVLAYNKLIGCKWVYKVKYKANDTLNKHKARLVPKGVAQQEGIDY